MGFDVLGVRIDELDRDQLTKTLERWLSGFEQKLVVTPNPEFILAAQKDKRFKEILNDAHLSLPDGVGLRFAVSALHDSDLPHRHPGVDTLRELARLCGQQNCRLVLFGGRGGSAGRAAAALRHEYSNLEVIPVEPGEISSSLGEPVLTASSLQKLREFEPVVLAVGLGQGKQEKFLAKYLEDLPSVKIGLGVGGAFDMIAGDLPRAPRLMRAMGLEWLWRLFLEPSRAPRIWRAAVIFPLMIAWYTMRRRHFLRSCARVLPKVLKQLRNV